MTCLVQPIEFIAPARRLWGVHEVHYALVIIGLFAPPFGVGFYGACAIGRVSPDDALGRMWPYLAGLAVALAIVVAFPWLSIGFL
jgi:TRAP-type C4-dicarboxylate transport system permease large subunit